MDKAGLRREMQRRRQGLAPAAWAGMSRHAGERLLALPQFTAAGTLLVYWSVDRELDTHGITAAAVAAGKRVALPRVVRWPAGSEPPAAAPVYGGGGRGLALHLFSGDPAELVPGPLGLLEPAAGAPAVTVAELDLVVVPGLAFDRGGWRLGYGGGYFDRLLAHVPARVCLVGLTFGFAILPELPRAPHDRPVHLVVSEAEVVKTGIPGC